MIKEISQQLAQRVEDVVHYLLPKGKKIGNEYCLGNIDGEHGRSLKIHLTGRKAGIWCDFESGGNQSGDLLDLWSSTRKITLVHLVVMNLKHGISHHPRGEHQSFDIAYYTSSLFFKPW